MKRYCETARHKIVPCDVGWTGYTALGGRTCRDEPKEENCRNLVDDNEVQTCPYCGAVLKQGDR